MPFALMSQWSRKGVDPHCVYIQTMRDYLHLATDIHPSSLVLFERRVVTCVCDSRYRMGTINEGIKKRGNKRNLRSCVT